MDDHTLREIIDAEKEIQQALEREKEKVRLWLETRNKEYEEEFARRKQQVLTAFEQARERARKNADEQASELVRRAEREAAGIANLSDDTLSGIVSHHLRIILPQEP